MLEIQGINIPTWVCISVPTAALIYGYLRSQANYWKKKGIPGPSPWILFGNMPSIMSQGISEFDKGLKQKYGRVVGTYFNGAPTLSIYDMDAMKEIMIKEFSSFQNHTNPGGQSYPFRKILNMLQFDHWKHVRNSMSPAFSGVKLRRLTSGINKCCNNWVSYLNTLADKGETFEMKDACGKVTMDIIANNVFGIDVDSSRNPDNEFQKHGSTIVNLTKKFSWKLMFLFTFPKLASKLGISFLDKRCQDFFDSAIKQAIQFRQEAEGEPVAKDFLQMMVDADRGEPTEDDMKTNPNLKKSEDGWVYSTDGLTTEEIIAAAFAFFFAGFDTVATSVALCMFELARNSDVQERLYQEITEVLGDKEEPDYDDIKKMTYLGMCVDESLRMYPPAVRTDRLCNKDTVINGINIEKGTSVVAPIIAFHYDPDVWPEPEKFDPERFTPEQKESRHPMAWMPFGQGPRHCIAMRQGLLQSKLIVLHGVKNFKLIATDDTKYPLKMLKLRQEPVDGLNLKVQRR